MNKASRQPSERLLGLHFFQSYTHTLFPIIHTHTRAHTTTSTSTEAWYGITITRVYHHCEIQYIAIPRANMPMTTEV